MPTIGGEVYFEAPYEQNCLVNAMCVGLARTEPMVRAAAAGVGNVVVLMGASTGRDGIGGASVLASAELEEGDEKRPTVQIGDPFEEKKVMECCLELLDRDLLVSLQDLGAAGLTSSACEMASAGGVGIDLDVARVPLRNPDLEPFEIMVSESQERMLAVVEPGQGRRRARDLPRVGDQRHRDRRGHRGRRDRGSSTATRSSATCRSRCSSTTARSTTSSRPTPGEWIYGNRAHARGDRRRPRSLLALLASPTIASKRWAFEQYDSIVQSRTVRRPEQADAAVLPLAETGTAIAVSIDGNGRRVACDPYLGTIEGVLECAANLACVGAEPLGLTNCLNFGNPEKPTVAWQLDRSTQALADACEALGVPVVGGNVSLYNETERGPIYPTPVVGMVGELPDPDRRPVAGCDDGDSIALAGPFRPALAGSELAKLRGELEPGLADFDLKAESAEAIARVREAVRGGGLRVAHDVSDGGLACALAECAIAGGVGLEVDLGEPDRRPRRQRRGVALRRGPRRLRDRRRGRQDRRRGRERAAR